MKGRRNPQEVLLRKFYGLKFKATKVFSPPKEGDFVAFFVGEIRIARTE